MKSKAMIIAQKVLIFGSSAGCLIAILFLPAQSPVRLWSIIGLAIGSIWQVINTRCPHCGRIGSVHPKLFPKDADKCIHCGETVEYK